MKTSQPQSFDFWTTFFVLFLIVFIVYFLIVLFRSNVIDDGVGVSGGQASYDNYTNSTFAKKLDINKLIHVLTPPTDNGTYSNFYLPPGKNDGDSITLLNNFVSGGVSQNISIFVDNVKTNDGAYSQSPWYPFALSYQENGSNQGSIARAVWYNNNWYLSNNNVNTQI